MVGPAEVGGELATPAELQRLVATLQGFPTTEEQDRQRLQVTVPCNVLSGTAQLLLDVTVQQLGRCIWLVMPRSLSMVVHGTQ